MSFLNEWSTFFPHLLNGLLVSLRLAAISLGVGIPVGLCLAVANGSQGRVIKSIAVVLVEIGRGSAGAVPPAQAEGVTLYDRHGVPATFVGHPLADRFPFDLEREAERVADLVRR